MAVTVCVVLLLTIRDKAPGLLLQMIGVVPLYRGSALEFVAT
jgi:hypothetical protein